MRCYSIEPDPFPAPPRDAVTALAVVRTDCGRERPENQDRAVIADSSADQAWEPPAALLSRVDPSGGFFALVCDGMGGELGGAIASSLAVQVIVGAMRSRFLQRSAEPAGSIALDEARISRAMAMSFEGASARIKQAGRDEPIYARMGTTATLATIVHGSLLCAQVGDSRAYVLRGERIAQVTEDQTMAELLRRGGGMSAEQIAQIVGPNVILQALGSSTKLEVALSRTPLARGDIVLLCSDGLYGVVDDDEIASELRGTSNLGTACDRLIALANDRGGPDNISVAAFVVNGGELPEAEGAVLAPVMLTAPYGWRE